MTIPEKLVLDTLASAWNQFILLPVLHKDDQDEFRHAIHAAQNVVLAREGMRTVGCFPKLAVDKTE